MKKYICFFSCLTSVLFGQKEGSNWFFGNKVGLNFDGTGIVKLISSNINAIEGCSVASDRFGNLLFYSNGETVWNKNNVVMTNGTGLHGWVSSTQSCVIVPFPNDTNQYYIFQVDGVTYDPNSGLSNYPFDSVLSYSIVNISASAGLGAVVQKNIKLFSPVNENIAAVKHANGIDTWIITHQLLDSNFVAFLITGNGISSPIVSAVGPIQENYTISHMKFSPDGKKISMSFGKGGDFTNNFRGSGYLHVFDFDNTTGVVFNNRALDKGSGGYGHSFSPNSNFLYASEGSTYLTQYDMLAGNSTASDIKMSRTIVYGQDSTYNYYMGWAIQNAIDGKTYVMHEYYADSNYMGVINYPNLAGKACAYDSKGIDLGGGPNKKGKGLPNFIESYFDPGYLLGTSSTLKMPEIANKVVIVSYVDDKLVFASKSAFITRVNILDLYGKLVFSETIENTTNYKEVDVGNFSPGVFFVEVYEGGKMLLREKVLLNN